MEAQMVLDMRAPASWCEGMCRGLGCDLGLGDVLSLPDSGTSFSRGEEKEFEKALR